MQFFRHAALNRSWKFQIYSSYRWITIPATAFASFLLLGFLEIGQEMYVLQVVLKDQPTYECIPSSENPFNYDYNDLGKGSSFPIGTYQLYLAIHRS